MYCLRFIIYLASGLFFGLLVFLWALKNGQFKDQQRARFLPLEDDEHLPAAGAAAGVPLQSDARADGN